MRCCFASLPALACRRMALIWILAGTARGQSGWLDFGGLIKGESRQENHVEWIEIESFNIDGELNAREAGKLGFRKRMDRASPPLLLACAKGSRYAKATLDLNYPAPDSGRPAPARIEMEDVMVSSVSVSSEGEVPMETFDLSFGRITYTYYADRFTSVVINYDFRYGTGSNGPGSNPDADADGLPDAWETTYGFPIGQNNAAEDADGDGFTNLQEYQLGTHPKSGTSFFKATLAPVNGSPGTYQLSWNSVAGKSYVIEWSPNLMVPFATLRTFTASGTTSTTAVTNAGNLGFYRVRPQ